MALSSREVQYSSASAGVYGTGVLLASRDDPWNLTTTTFNQETEDPNSDTILKLPCSFLQTGVSLRVVPMARQTGGWSDIHFHPQLRLPASQSPEGGMTVLLDAMARECVAVALSPTDSFHLGTTYVVHFGASGNVSTVIRRRLPRRHDPEESEGNHYRHDYRNEESVDASFPSRICSEQSWISYWICWIPTSRQVWVGVGKVPGQRCIGYLQDDVMQTSEEDGSSLSTTPIRYVGLGNSALGRQAEAIKYRNVVVTSLPEYLPGVLEELLHQDLPMVMVDDDEMEDAETKALMEEYQAECRKSKARAKKFNIPFKEPPAEAFLQWSKARRLRANPRKGFLTGIDLMSTDEMAKQEARKRRFGMNDNEEANQDNDNNNELDENEAGDDGQHDEGGKRAKTKDGDQASFPVLEAWDNEDFVRGQRVDPPPQLWNEPPQDTIPVDPERVPSEGLAMVPEKVHIFTIDWAAFRQIRTDDIMAYLSVYGPSYVEWMGELSCNVLFEDKYSAARALKFMSTELPTPPPEELIRNHPNESDEMYEPPDLGNMGWRLCKQPIRKLVNDRYGRRGTRARILMRLATTMDVLAERPTSLPPPPGFSTRRVLGPGSEFESGPNRKRHRPDGNEAREGIETEETADSSSEPALLNRALRSGRSGFTVEQMEAERQAARRQDGLDDAKQDAENDQDVDLGPE